MKIMFFSSNTKEKGGAEIVRTNIVIGLRSRGHEVIDVRNSRREEGSWIKVIRSNTVHARVHVPAVSKNGLLNVRRSKNLFGSAMTVRKLMSKYKPDVVVTNFLDASSLYFTLAKRYFTFKHVIILHGSDALVSPHKGTDHSRAIPRVLKEADYVVGVSGPVLNAARTLAPAISTRSAVIWNGIDVAYWRQPPTSLPPRKDALLFAAGRLEQVKGYDVLLDAFAIVKSRRADAQLRVAGEGSEHQALEQKARDLGIDDAVEFMGWCDADAVKAELYGAAVSVMPSRSEGLPGSLMEAMATGIPVVATEVGGIPDLVRHGETGLLVPPENPEMLTNALCKMLEDAELRTCLAKQAQAFISDNTWERCVDQYVGVFEQLVEQEPAKTDSKA